ncbi:hypothetical protein MTO96_041516 [Rhipicephalus appendiculatus]
MSAVVKRLPCLGAGLDTGMASAAAELPAESLALRWVKLERDVLDTVCHEALVHWLELLTVLSQDDHCETLGSPEVRFKINLAPADVAHGMHLASLTPLTSSQCSTLLTP